jgi:hypothetical protein
MFSQLLTHQTLFRVSYIVCLFTATRAIACSQRPCAQLRRPCKASQKRLEASATARKAPAGTRTICPPWGGQWRHRRYTSHKMSESKYSSYQVAIRGTLPKGKKRRKAPLDGGIWPRARVQPPRRLRHGSYHHDLLPLHTSYEFPRIDMWPAAHGQARRE